MRFLRATLCCAILLFCSWLSLAARSHASLAPSCQEPRAINPSSSDISATEQFFSHAANKERSSRGLREYKWDDALAAAARKHALLMGRSNTLSHQLSGEAPLSERIANAGARFSSVGENVAMGTEAARIQDGWMHSPGHRANILSTHFTALGVGVVEAGGEIYAVEDFSTAVEDLSIEQQEGRVKSMLAASGVQVLDDPSEARKFCSASYVPAPPRDLTIVSLQVPDLGTIPEEIKSRLHGKRFRAADVGACPSLRMKNGVLYFRVNILLFPE